MEQQIVHLAISFFAASFLHALFLWLLFIALIGLTILTYWPSTREFLNKLAPIEPVTITRRVFILLAAEILMIIGLWYIDTYVTSINARFYPFTLMTLALTLIGGYMIGFGTMLFVLPLIVLYLIDPRYRYFPQNYQSIIVTLLLEMFAAYGIGCVIRHYQDKMMMRLFTTREQLHFNALEKVALQSEEKALLRAIDTSSAVVTSSEMSLTSILSTSQYWLSNVLRIVAEETRHLTGGSYAGIALLDGEDVNIVTFASDGNKGQGDKLAILRIRQVLHKQIPQLKNTKLIPIVDTKQQTNQQSFATMLVAPIRSKQTVLGALFVTNKVGTEKEKAFNEFDRRRVQLFASYAGLSIVNMHHYEKLSGLVEGRDRLLSMVSHELKTPLSTIKLYAQLLHEQDWDEKNQAELRRGLTTIDLEVDKLTMLVNSIHDFSRIRSGIFAIEHKEFNVSKLCQDRLKIVQSLYPDHTFIFKQALTAKTIVADKMRLDQVITNLLINAAKYSDPGTIITLELKKSNDSFKIMVHDQGRGIAKEELGQIFEPFYQAKSTNSVNKGKGLGLGLYIAKEIVRHHGGTLSVSSKVDQGSTFTIGLPVKFLHKQAKPQTVSRPVAYGRRLRGFALGRQR